jgi:DNA primase
LLIEKISQIKEANDIVEVVSRHVPLKRSGRNYRALCPFHPDKEPSFYVNPERQLFKCFGCGAAGDVIAFVMKVEGLAFQDAVRQLAKRAGIEIGDISKSEGKTAALLGANETAASFYHKVLLGSPEGAAFRYLKKRAIPEDVIKKFRLGWAPDSWGALLDFALSQGVKVETLLEAGLAAEGKDGGHYDFFRNRLIFPIFDHTGRVVGFGGRVLDDSLPKYINTKETPLFRKSSILYGFNFARPKVFETRAVVVTEGYTDVMRAHEKGFTQVVATLGTALTEDHARMIRRYADSVTVLFDADAAGKKASQRGVEVLLAESLDVKVARLPAEKDLFDYLSRFSGEEFQKVLASSEEIFDFSLRIAGEKYDTKTVRGASEAVNEIVSLIRMIPDKQTREIAIDRVSLHFGVNRRDVALRAGNVRNTPQREQPSHPAVSLYKEMDILDIVFNRPDLIERAESAFGPESFEDSELSEIAAAAYKMYRECGSLNSEGIFAKNEGLRKRLLQVFEYGRNKGERDYETILTSYIAGSESRKKRSRWHEKARQDPSALSEIREVYEHRKRTKH